MEDPVSYLVCPAEAENRSRKSWPHLNQLPSTVYTASNLSLRTRGLHLAEPVHLLEVRPTDCCGDSWLQHPQGANTRRGLGLPD